LETYTREQHKRATKETYKRDLQKTICVSSEPSVYGKTRRPTQESYQREVEKRLSQRDLQKRCAKETFTKISTRETYKRDLQKRKFVSNETSVYGKTWKPTHETYQRVLEKRPSQRDLRKRPTKEKNCVK